MMESRKAWVISVDMGYGHQRAAYPLKDIAYERIITANSDKIVTPEENKIWHRFQGFYETISRFRSIPIIGNFLWHLFDRMQSITPYYPFRDLSQPSIGSTYLYWLVKNNFMKSLVTYTRTKNIPVVCTFFGPAIAANYWNRKDVYCVVTDTDINRIWVPQHMNRTKMYYLTPTEQSTKRLMEYGVKQDKLLFTGFPLPKENTGHDMEILKKDLGERIPNLDSKHKFMMRQRDVVKKMLGDHYCCRHSHPLTLTFAVGGAGAQQEIGLAMLHSLRQKIHDHKIRVNIAAGTRLETAQRFIQEITRLELKHELGKYVNVLFALSKAEHFQGFNKALRETDILWTKPSEVSFYTALGLPIIIAPPLGAHEICNRDWLIRMGAGFAQENPHYANEWLFEWLDQGHLASAAWNGFMGAPKFGTYNIENVIFARNKQDIKFRY